MSSNSDPSTLIPPDAIETPAAIVDLGQARRNAVRARSELASHGLEWRPHVKTHKSRTLARIQLDTGVAGLTVATLHEAEVMATLGADLLLAHPPVGPAKGRRLTDFLRHHPLSVGLDSKASLDTTAEAARNAEREVPILVEVDVGMGRVGLGSSEEVVALAREAGEGQWTEFAGLLFYPGHIRVPAEEQGGELERVSRRLTRVLEALGAAGLPARIVSGGSTPTLWQSHRIEGVTEIRAGTCIFHDRDTVAMGVARPDEVAYRILTTVVSTAVSGQAVVDAGSKALAKEEFRSGGRGYGVVRDRPEVTVRAVSEEHGILDLTGTSWRPRVGDRVELVPNHVCVSVNLQDRLLAEEAGGFRPVPIEGRGRVA
jgi:D-serine deaminase-like pyridoxal phosphate-dependent protein